MRLANCTLSQKHITPQSFEQLCLVQCPAPYAQTNWVITSSTI